jgi:hypothetical protein
MRARRAHTSLATPARGFRLARDAGYMVGEGCRYRFRSRSMNVEHRHFLAASIRAKVRAPGHSGGSPLAPVKNKIFFGGLTYAHQPVPGANGCETGSTNVTVF